MDMMGKKIQIEGMDEESMKNNPMMSMSASDEKLDFKVNKKEKHKVILAIP